MQRGSFGFADAIADAGGDVQPGIKPREFHDLLDVVAEVGEHKFAASALYVAVELHHHAQAHAGDHLHLGHVKDKLVLVRRGEGQQLWFENVGFIFADFFAQHAGDEHAVAGVQSKVGRWHGQR